MRKMEIRLEKMAHGGEALGFYEGKAIFVAGGIAGERVQVEIEEDHRSWARARLLEVLTPSPYRVEPPCPYFGRCGGCQWQHIDYKAQLQFKREILAEQLARIGGLEAEIFPVVPSPWPWHYRNSVRFRVTPEGMLAFQALRSTELVVIEECYILHPLVEEVLEAVEMELPPLLSLKVKVGVRTGHQLLVLETAHKETLELSTELPVSCVLIPPSGPPVVMAGSDFIQEEVAGRLYRISAMSFFQANTPQAEKLVEIVEEFLTPEGKETLLDGYCGVGLFGLALADKVARVIGVEENPFAVNDALLNAEMQGAGNALFIQGRMEEVSGQLEEKIDLAVVDPPRTGMEKEALEGLVRLKPQKIAYVSCDPATLARDLAFLVKNGYVLEKVQPVDMFPQTFHIESISLLRLRS
ncbi:MAG: 23S rRNA (uracil(1939)-C(5))-methyltransferase RlmD [Anaerolineae bacterium]|nr:23S rRNA (uracil(1939)-C(5))-methyltransferase RlmD [Anaerolineae bacterium]